MKSLFLNLLKRLTIMMVLLGGIQLVAKLNDAKAQLPDCTTGGTMYSVFNNIGGSTTADSMEVRPIDVTTGAVGALIGNRRYWIRKNIGGTWYYGAAALGADLISNRFYVSTQMSSGGGKDIISLDPIAPTATGIVIGTTPVALNNYHIVKMAISPTGLGYALGVHRDSTQPAATCNVLIRFNTCGALPSAGCATASIITLGYLPPTGNMYKWLLFNGDIAFDFAGNLYFATAAFERVAGIGRYTDARLFRINAADIPAVAGAGTIPMTFLAEYDGLDSTVINGLSLDPAGNFYMSTRRFTGVQTSPAGPSNSELYKSFTLGSETLISGFGPIPPNFSIGDLASCYFPNTVLANKKILLTSRAVSGNSSLKWEVNNNHEVSYYEVERSFDGNTFKAIARISPTNPTQRDQTYFYTDEEKVSSKMKFYRVREITPGGIRFYSNIVQTSGNKINLISKPKPNPVSNYFDFDVHLKNAGKVNVQLTDQNGRVVYRTIFNGQAGDNTFNVQGMASFKPGIYIVELSVGDEVIHEKIFKQ